MKLRDMVVVADDADVPFVSRQGQMPRRSGGENIVDAENGVQARIAGDQLGNSVAAAFVQGKFCTDVEDVRLLKRNAVINVRLPDAPDAQMIIFVFDFILKDSDVPCSPGKQFGRRHIASAEFVAEYAAQILRRQLLKSVILIIEEDKTAVRMASRQIQGGCEFVDRDQYHTEDVFRFFKLYGKLFRCVFAGNDQQVYRRCLFRRRLV